MFCHSPRALSASQATHVVVGGGIAGLSTAFNLLRFSRASVTLVEKTTELAQGASRKNGFLLCPSLDYPWTCKSQIFDLNDISNGILPNAIIRPNESPVRFKVGSLYNPSVFDFGINWVGRSLSKEPIGNLMQYSMQQYQSPPLSMLHFDQGFSQGTEVNGHVDMRDSSGDIKKFCEELRSLMIKEHGGRFQVETNQKISKVLAVGNKVVELRMQDHKASESANEKSITGDKFIVAAGTGSRAILKDIGVACPTVPIKGYLLTFSSSTKVSNNMKLPKKIFVAPMGVEKGSEGGTRYMYRCSGLAEFGGSEVGTDWEGRDRPMGKSDRAALELMRGVISEQFKDIDVVDEDYGFRCLAPDDVPLIGRTKYENLFLNTGHGSKGWTMGAGSGKLCAHLVLGMEPEIEASWYDPMRFEAALKQIRAGSVTSNERFGLSSQAHARA